MSAQAPTLNNSNSKHTPITEWLFAPEIDVLRILHTTNQMVTGFYRLQGFLVVPHTYKGEKKDLVILPDLDFTSIPRFWQQAKLIDKTTVPIHAPEALKKATLELYLKSKLPDPDYKDIESLWAEAEHEVLDAIYTIIPGLRNSIRRIYIYPTKYGTRASFDKIRDFPCEVHMHLREDADLFDLTSALIMAITRNKIYTKFKGMWSESQLLVDWLVEESLVSEVLYKYQSKRVSKSSMDIVRSYHNNDAYLASQELFKKLGLPHEKSAFDVTDAGVYVDGKPLQGISPNEHKILGLLVDRRGNVVTTDELADILFENDDDFSLYTISKNIERLRNRLEFNGLTGGYIKTVRGEGYLLR